MVDSAPARTRHPDRGLRWLRAALHGLVALLLLFIAVRAVVERSDAPAVVMGCLVVGAVYIAGLVILVGRRAHAWVWLLALSIAWAGLLLLTPDAAYLVVVLFLLDLHLLGRRLGPAAVAVTAVAAVLLRVPQDGWSVGGVLGPLLFAGVAVVIGFGYETLRREAARREALMAELLDARDRVAAAEREAGVLAERARLARDIHDTVAQGLASIQMLLHAAERAAPDQPGIDHVRLARRTAAANLDETRRLIRELTPPDLDAGLGAALRRLAASQWAGQGLTVRVDVADPVGLPVDVQTALLRIAQGAVANTMQHGRATEATIELSVRGDQVLFRIADDGVGFDLDSLDQDAGAHSDSFGLRATRERVDQLGGRLTVDSAPGRGTTITVALAMAAA